MALFLMLFVCVVGVVSSTTTPEQIHLAYGDSQDANGFSTGMSVSWFTQDMAASVVKYSTVGGVAMQATGESKEYYKGYGFHHHVALDNLASNTTYNYNVGDPANSFSETFSFTTPAASSDYMFSIACYGDWGYLGSEERPMKIAVDGLVKNWTAIPTRQRLEALKNSGDIQALWHVGDIAYADDAFAHAVLGFEYEDTYNGFMNWIQNLSSRYPYMVAVGNHESECHSPNCILDRERGLALSNFSAYNARWKMPSKSSNGVLNMWYSWNVGPVHFISINTETDFPGAGEEHTGDSNDKNLPAGSFGAPGEYNAWLEADLKKASQERSIRPWIIAGGHRTWGEASNANLRVKELFAQYGVDVYIAGHAHSYARYAPGNSSVQDIANMTSYPASLGLTSLVAGGTGCDEMTNQGMMEETYNPMEAKTSADPVYATNTMAPGVLTVLNKTAIRWRLYGSYSGEILDEVVITK
eukprot:m.313802 g.313802  ORF g.313802 m.313802 type:complete len:470 (-) comp16491_c9_seq37:1829-3238(-)